MLVSGVQQTDSVIYIYIYIYILFQILFSYRLLQNIEYSSLCYTVGPCWLSVLHIVVYMLINLLIYPSPPPFPLGNYKFVFYVCESLSVL